MRRVRARRACAARPCMSRQPWDMERVWSRPRGAKACRVLGVITIRVSKKWQLLSRPVSAGPCGSDAQRSLAETASPGRVHGHASIPTASEQGKSARRPRGARTAGQHGARPRDRAARGGPAAGQGGNSAPHRTQAVGHTSLRHHGHCGCLGACVSVCSVCLAVLRESACASAHQTPSRERASVRQQGRQAKQASGRPRPSASTLRLSVL